MAIDVYLDDVETENIGGFDRVQPGSYHAKIHHVDENGGRKGEMVVDFEILRGTTSNQEGKLHREFFSADLKAFARKKLLALAIAGGLTTKVQLDQHKAAGTAPKLDFVSMIGRHVCLDLEPNEYNGKTTTKLAWDQVYHPTDKRASHIPVVVSLLTAAGIKLPEGRNPDGAVSVKGGGGSSAGGAAKPSTKPPVPSDQQAASMDALLSGV